MGERELDDWLSGYMDFTEQTEPPILYRKWVAVSTVAACLQRKCWMQWHRPIYPNMYIILVGPSGKCRKTEAMYPGEAMLRKLSDIRLAADAATKEALAKTIVGSKTSALDPKTQVMVEHCSVTVFSKELTVLLGYNNPELMSWLTQWYDCDDPWIYDTKNKGTDSVRGVWVNLLGATTPQLIQTTLPRDAVGGGLTSRMIFVYEEKKGRRVHYPIPSHATQELGSKVLRDLDRIYALQGQFKLSQCFMEFWGPWYDSNEDNPPFVDPAFDGYMSRRPTHLLKLSMIMSACRGDDMVIKQVDTKSGLDLLVATERKMPYTFRGMGKSRYADVLVALQDKISRAGKIDISELLNQFSQDVTKREMLELIYTLESMKKVKITSTGDNIIVRWLGDSSR